MKEKRSKREDFFSELEENPIRDAEYAERLQEELSDHIDDAVYDMAFDGIDEEEATENIIQRFQPAATITAQCNEVLARPLLYVYGEAYFITMLQMPMYFWFIGVLSSLLSAPHIELIAVFQVILSASAIVIAMFFGLRRLAPELYEQKRRISIMAMVLLFPTIFLLTDYYSPIVRRIAAQDVGVLLLALLWGACSLVFAWEILRRRFYQKQHQKGKRNIVLSAFGIFFVLYVLGTCIVLATGWYEHEIVQALFVLPELFERIRLHTALYISLTQLYPTVGAALNVFLHLFVLSYLVVRVGKYVVLRMRDMQPRLPWFSLSFGLYIVCILFFTPWVEPEVEWHVEANDVYTQDVNGLFHRAVNGVMSSAQPAEKHFVVPIELYSHSEQAKKDDGLACVHQTKYYSTESTFTCSELWYAGRLLFTQQTDAHEMIATEWHDPHQDMLLLTFSASVLRPEYQQLVPLQ